MASIQFMDTFSVLIPLPDLGSLTSHFVVNNIRGDHLLRDPGVHDGEPLERDPHITIHMGLGESQSEIASQVCKEYQAFDITLGEFHVFRTAKIFEDSTYHEYDVLVRKISSPQLVSIHQDLVAKTGKPWHFPQYSAHLTYAYLKYGTGMQYAEEFNSRMIPALIRRVEYVVVKKFKDNSATEMVVLTGSRQ